MTTRRAVLMVTAFVGPLALWASSSCTSFGSGSDDAGVLQDGSPTGDGPSPEGEVGDGEPPPPDCLSPNEPARNPEKCLVDSFAAFVSPKGDDENNGTKANPYRTIAKALTTTRERIVVCEGDYAGSIDVGRRVAIFGGVSCDWSKAGAKPRISASKPAYGVQVVRVAEPVLLADLDVVGLNGAAPSESSIALFVSESANVTIARSTLTAGDGADAPPKKDGAFAMPPSAPGGGNAVGNVGGPAVTTGTCPGGGSSGGGKGGDSGFQGDDGVPRPPGGSKGAFAFCSAGGGGNDGEVGTAGGSRPGGAVTAVLNRDGFAGARGQDGANGMPGGGGGGGSGSMGAGGGGGAGGCGGQGGGGGGAGGSSIALLSFGSLVVLQGVELTARTAKSGGAGGSGQTGQAGGFGGAKTGGACLGGNGMKGGDGGAGGGGAGGIAVGIAWAGGKAPTRDGATKTTRPTSAAPAGGEGGAGASNKGVDGIHADVYEVK